MEVWICGQYLTEIDTGKVWEFAGVFDSEQKAIDACRDQSYFIAPYNINEIHPHETVPMEGIYYPKNKYDSKYIGENKE